MVPEEGVEVGVKNVRYLHPCTAVQIDEWETNEICMLWCVKAVQSLIVIAVGEPFFVDEVVDIIRGSINNVNDTNFPRWPEASKPVDNCHLVCWVYR